MMNNTEHLHPMGETHHSHGQTPYWKRAHHDWRFWGAVFLMLAAMIIYVMSDDLALRPRSQPPQAPSDAVGK